MEEDPYDDFFNEEANTDDYHFITPALTVDPSLSSSTSQPIIESTPAPEPIGDSIQPSADLVDDEDDLFFASDLDVIQEEESQYEEEHQEEIDDPFFDEEFQVEEESDDPPSPDDPDFDEKFAEWELRMAAKYEEDVASDYTASYHEPEPSIPPIAKPVAPIIPTVRSSLPSSTGSSVPPIVHHVSNKVPSIVPKPVSLPIHQQSIPAVLPQARLSTPAPVIASAMPSIPPPVAIRQPSVPVSFESAEHELNTFSASSNSSKFIPPVFASKTPSMPPAPQQYDEPSVNYDEIRDIPPLPPFDDSSLLSYTAYLDERCLSQGFLDEAFMWHLGSLLIQTRGGLPFENFGGSTDLNGAELAANLRDLLFANTPYHSVRYDINQNWSALSTNFFNDLETKLITSKMDDAFDFSMQTGQYHIAMVLASFIGPTEFNRAVTATAEKLPQGSALRALFAAIVGDPMIWNPTNDTDWRQILAVLLANRTAGATKICQKLGDHLAQHERIGASVVCHVIGGVPADSISLLRSNHPLFNNFRQILSHVQTLRKDAKPLQLTKTGPIPEPVEKPQKNSKIGSLVGDVAGSLFKEAAQEKVEKVQPPDQHEEGKKGFFGKLMDVFSRDSTSAFLGDDLGTTSFTPQETFEPPPMRQTKPEFTQPAPEYSAPPQDMPSAQPVAQNNNLRIRQRAIGAPARPQMTQALPPPVIRMPPPVTPPSE